MNTDFLREAFSDPDVTAKASDRAKEASRRAEANLAQELKRVASSGMIRQPVDERPFLTRLWASIRVKIKNKGIKPDGVEITGGTDF